MDTEEDRRQDDGRHNEERGKAKTHCSPPRLLLGERPCLKRALVISDSSFPGANPCSQLPLSESLGFELPQERVI